METIQSHAEAQPLAVFRGESGNENCSSACPEALWPLPAEMLRLFEEMTGWVVEFQESKTSFQQRRVIQSSRSSSRCLTNLDRQVKSPDPAKPSEALPIADGLFAISDMSAHWPPGRPTSHRAKCEQFLDLINQFLGQIKTDREELNHVKSVLAGTCWGDQWGNSDENLSDAFPPRHPYQTKSETEQDFVVSYHSRQRTLDDLQTISSESKVVRPKNQKIKISLTKTKTAKHETLPHRNAEHWHRTGFGSMSKWQLGGRRGMMGNRYVDWVIEDDGHIELISGMIGTEKHFEDQDLTDDCENRLVLNPRSEKFWLRGDSPGWFWVYDQSSQIMTTVPEKLCRLNAGQSLVASTSCFLQAQQCPLRIPMSMSIQHADQIAKNIQEFLGFAEPVLVLARID